MYAHQGKPYTYTLHATFTPHALNPTPTRYTPHRTRYALHPHTYSAPYILHPATHTLPTRYTPLPALHPTGYTPYPTPHTLQATRYTLPPHPTHTLHATPYTLHAIPHTLHPTPCIPHPTPSPLHPTHYAPYSPHVKPCTLHPTPYTYTLDLHSTPRPRPRSFTSLTDKHARRYGHPQRHRTARQRPAELQNSCCSHNELDLRTASRQLALGFHDVDQRARGQEVQYLLAECASAVPAACSARSCRCPPAG